MQKGFTLVEILLYLAIFSLAIGSFSGAYILYSQSRVKNQTIFEVDSQSLSAMNIVLQAIRNAESVSTPSAGGNGTTLNLAYADSAKNPTVITVSGGALTIKEGSGSTVTLTSPKIAISAFNVNNYSQGTRTDNAKVSFTASYNSSTTRNEYKFSRTYYGNATTRD